jgi:hypothetical protein
LNASMERIEAFEPHSEENEAEQERAEQLPLRDEADPVAYLAHEHQPESESVHELRERAFRVLVDRHLVNSWREALADADFESDEIDGFIDALGACSEEELDRVLSVPDELRGQILEHYRERIDNDELEPNDMVGELRDKASRNGFSIGFHTSNHDIRPDEEGRWMIRGTEQDHRDNDMSMAYYAKDYEAMYRRKQPQYIYVVRARDEDRTDGKWWRAPSLSVIAQLPMQQVQASVEEITQEAQEQARASGGTQQSVSE